ncbi:MAG: bacteriochlorophyll 4-vinyl reductase [Pseudomonadota bacterium]
MYCMRPVDAVSLEAAEAGLATQALESHWRRADEIISRPKPVTSGRVGPNAVLQLAAALAGPAERPLLVPVFEQAGCANYLKTPPEEMIPESDAAALHQAVFDIAGSERARTISADAGRRTADYVMANRIPGFAKTILRALPPGIAGPMLARAIEKHAWTFCGSGSFSIVKGGGARSLVVKIANNPLETPGCAWHCAVFERMFQQLVSSKALVRYKKRHSQDSEACLFSISY